MGEKRALEMKRRHDLATCLLDRQEAGLGMRWGVVITTDTTSREIRATTTAGTTVTLTPERLEELARVDSYLGGRQPAVVGPVPADHDEFPSNLFMQGQPVPAVTLAVYLPTGWQSTGGSLELTTILHADDIEQMPMILLTTQRPAGWPR